GYAAVRAAIALNADAALVFAPQVLIEPAERVRAELPIMPFDDALCLLKRVTFVEGVNMTSLVKVVFAAPSSVRTSIEVHVGTIDFGDAIEAVKLREAVAELGDRTSLSVTVHEHAGCDHNLVTHMRDSGELHSLLVKQLRVEFSPKVMQEARCSPMQEARFSPRRFLAAKLSAR
ncbi:unnamed protein product, partial [Polarella glacialis]